MLNLFQRPSRGRVVAAARVAAFGGCGDFMRDEATGEAAERCGTPYAQARAESVSDCPAKAAAARGTGL
jgi:hypothetical protein